MVNRGPKFIARVRKEAEAAILALAEAQRYEQDVKGEMLADLVREEVETLLGKVLKRLP
jgi:hypothetical protein